MNSTHFVIEPHGITVLYSRNMIFIALQVEHIIFRERNMTDNDWYYVTKDEYQPVKNHIDSLIGQAQRILRQQGLTFQIHSIGSGRRKLITAKRNSNKGFDFDYNLEIKYCPKDSNPAQIKNMVREAFRTVLKNTRFKDPDDSTSVLTINCVDTEHSKIIHGFDLALIYYDQNGNLHYIRRDPNGSYVWAERGYRFDDRAYVKEIKEYYVDGWGLIRDEYLKLKNNNNDPNKRSFDLYTEAVMNVHYWMQQEIEQYDEDEDD